MPTRLSLHHLCHLFKRSLVTCSALSLSRYKKPLSFTSWQVRTPSMNAGILFVRASEWSLQLLSAWMHAPDTPVHDTQQQQAEHTLQCTRTQQQEAEMHMLLHTLCNAIL